MTIASQTSRITYTGDGVTTAFAVPFYFQNNADLVVLFQDTFGNQTVKVLGTDYTLAGATLPAGGTATFTVAPVTGTIISIYRDPPVTQNTSYNNNDPFPAKSHELALDKLTTLEQRTRNLVTRSLQLRDSDPTVDMHLPQGRQNKLLGFDGNNAPVAVNGPSFVGGTDIGAAVVSTRAVASVTTFPNTVIYLQTGGYATVGDGGGAKYQRGTGSGSFTDGGGVSWVPISEASGSVLYASTFGVVGDGVTDDTAALQAAATAAAGKTLVIRGLCGVSSRIVLQANTTIMGNNNKLDGFVVLGSSSLSTGILYSNNKSGIAIRNLRFQGNLVEPAALSTGAIMFDGDTGTPVDTVGIEISKCYFEQFRTTQWVWIVRAANALDVNSTREIKIFNNEVFATAACAVTAAISGVNGNTFVLCTGNTLTGFPANIQSGSNVGQISNILFTNNSAVGLGLSGMFAGHINVRDVVVSGNVTRNMGNNTVAADRTYTYLFYNSSTGVCADPTNIVVNNNVGYGNHNNAIYFAGCVNATVSGNSFGFTYPSGIEPTLPHGAAIALNGCVDSAVVGNTLTDALGGVAYVGISDRASTVTIAGNTIRSSTNSSATQVAYGVLLSGSANNAASITNIVGNSITLTGTTASGIYIVGGAGQNYGTINLADNVISATQIGINCTATLLASVTLFLSNNRYGGAISLFGMNIDSAGQVYIHGEVVDATLQVSGGAVGVRLNPGTLYSIDGLTIANGNVANTAFSASGTVQGTLRNITFPGWAGTQVLAGSIGLAIPTWTAKIGATVENLAKVITGTGGYATVNQKYIVDHWINASGTNVWLEQRQLTGA